MYQSGIPLTQGLHLLAQSKVMQKYQRMLLLMQQRLELGEALSKSLRRYPDLFPEFYQQLFYLGEASGRLQEVLQQLTHLLQQQLELKQSILGALFYPLCVCSINGLVFFSMLWWVVPQYQQLFKNTDELPYLTAWLFRISGGLHAHPLSLALVLIIGCVGGNYLIRHSPLKAGLLRYVTQVYGISTLIDLRDLTLLCAQLSLCLKAGLTFTHALKLCAHLSINPSWQKTFIALERDIHRGKSLRASVAKHEAIPLLMQQCIHIGETTGKLEQQLQTLAQIYQQELTLKLQQLTRLIEPLMMIILGVGVGAMMLGLYQPLLQLGNLV